MISRIAPMAGAVPRPEIASVTVTVPARLHLGFLDMDGGLGRRFGSLGITLDGPCARLTLAAGEAISGTGPSAERAAGFLDRLLHTLGMADGFRLTVAEAIPEHSGLGSGTQLALAVGMALARLCGRDMTARDVARLLHRGARSGIGVGAFEEGGVILDGGRGDGDGPPPVLCRLPFPDDWRILLIFDRARRGMHGTDETEAFRDLPPFTADRAGRLCRLMLMAALPAVAERDLDRFGAAVAELQRTTGDYFASFQGGRYASPKVAEVLAWLTGEGIVGLGQSSWGPTGFALVAGEEPARALADAARRRWADDRDLDFKISRGRNSGADVVVEAIERRAIARSRR